MRGGFVLVVGPSGAGKDTLIALAKHELAHDARFLFPRRVVTRPNSAWEDHDSIDPETFERAKAAGRFCLSWRAHGLCYGIGADVLAATRLGRIGVCNVSRRIIDDARRTLPNVAVVEISAPIAILIERLAKRGREEAGDLRERILRSQEVGEIRADMTVVNDRAPQEGAVTLISFLKDHAAKNLVRTREALTSP